MIGLLCGKCCLRFLRHDGIYRPDVFQTGYCGTGGMVGAFRQLEALAMRSSATESIGGDGDGEEWFRARLKTAPGSSFAMSSGRLFLDQGARQQSLSPLHRQAHGTTRAE